MLICVNYEMWYCYHILYLIAVPVQIPLMTVLMRLSSIITLYMYKLCSIDTALFSGLAHERAKTTIRVFGSEC